MLVIMTIIALLAAILLPAVSRARELGRIAVCQGNLRSLQVANQLYAQNHLGQFVPGAASFQWPPGKANLQRWFGRRSNPGARFKEDNGPLSQYLPGYRVRRCPSFRDPKPGFESGCGGYGYNNNYVGQQRERGNGQLRTDLAGSRLDLFADPGGTVAFSDTAFVNGGLIEYSFCESPTWPDNPGQQPRPSVHFRHLDTAGVVWLDGHVSDETMSFSGDAMGFHYRGRPADYNVGWFGPTDNELFDYE
jgi:prepilin-type processing-associated H-X9-DG protein